MALSDLVLSKGEVIVISSDSKLGIISDGKDLMFGVVQRVNDLCDITAVGDSVMFNVNRATPFMIVSGQLFYLIQEQYLSFSEPTP